MSVPDSNNPPQVVHMPNDTQENSTYIKMNIYSNYADTNVQNILLQCAQSRLSSCEVLTYVQKFKLIQGY